MPSPEQPAESGAGSGAESVGDSREEPGLPGGLRARSTSGNAGLMRSGSCGIPADGLDGVGAMHLLLGMAMTIVGILLNMLAGKTPLGGVPSPLTLGMLGKIHGTEVLWGANVMMQ